MFSLALCNTCINFFNFMIFPFRLIVCIYLKVQNVGMSGMSWWEKSFGIRKGCWTAGRYGCLVSLWAVDRVSLLSCCSTVNTIGQLRRPLIKNSWPGHVVHPVIMKWTHVHIDSKIEMVNFWFTIFNIIQYNIIVYSKTFFSKNITKGPRAISLIWVILDIISFMKSCQKYWDNEWECKIDPV